MVKKLIVKIKKEGKEKFLIRTECEKFKVQRDEKISNILTLICSFLNIQGVNNAVPQNLENLHILVEKGFAIRIDEMEDHLRFIAYKGQASTSCGVSKEKGISSLLKNAEDFAEEFLEDLKTNTSCGV